MGEDDWLERTVKRLLGDALREPERRPATGMAAMRTGFGAGRTGAIDTPADEGYSAPYRLWKFPSLAKEGWRAAPRWFDRGDFTTPIGALYIVTYYWVEVEDCS